MKHLGIDYTQVSGLFFCLNNRKEIPIFRTHIAVENTHQGWVTGIGPGSIPFAHRLPPPTLTLDGSGLFVFRSRG